MGTNGLIQTESKTDIILTDFEISLPESNSRIHLRDNIWITTKYKKENKIHNFVIKFCNTPYSDQTKHKNTTPSHEYSLLKILGKNLEEFVERKHICEISWQV